MSKANPVDDELEEIVERIRRGMQREMGRVSPHLEAGYTREEAKTKLLAWHSQGVGEAEKRGAAFAMNNLALKVAMDGRKTVKQSWIDSKGEAWAISIVEHAQNKGLKVQGYDQWAADVNKHHLKEQS